MTKQTDIWDAQLSAGVDHMMTLQSDEERASYARAFRVSMGFESRFRAYGKHWPARLWNWLIDADSTTISGIPPIVPVILVAVLVGCVAGAVAIVLAVG